MGVGLGHGRNANFVPSVLKNFVAQSFKFVFSRSKALKMLEGYLRSTYSFKAIQLLLSAENKEAE